MYKEIGETTGLFSARIKHLFNANKVAICGKLDPLAHGLVTILLDDECKLMSLYLNTTKKYRILIGTGFSTDTDDLMGMQTSIGFEFKFKFSSRSLLLLLLNASASASASAHEIEKYIYEYCQIGKQWRQQFHHFSAINIIKNQLRKPLHYWYLRGLLEDTDIPTKDVVVYSLQRLDDLIIPDYSNNIINKLEKLPRSEWNNFRIPEIIDQYQRHIFPLQSQLKVCQQYEITVSSGFYVRMIAKHINCRLVEMNVITRIHIADIERI